jgi:hypothetical protein
MAIGADTVTVLQLIKNPLVSYLLIYLFILKAVTQLCHD